MTRLERIRRSSLGLLAVAALLLSAEPVLTGLHFLTTAHFYCLQHQSLAHAEVGRRHVSHLDVSGADGRGLAHERGDDILGHDHCSHRLVCSRLEMDIERGGPVVKPPGLATRPAASSIAVAPPLSPLAVAPKGSPPAPAIV